MVAVHLCLTAAVVAWCVTGKSPKPLLRRGENMADRPINFGKPHAQIVELLAVRQSVLDEVARNRRLADMAGDGNDAGLSASDWDKGYAKGLRDAIDVIAGIRPVAQRMDAESCLDGISAIFNYMSVPGR